MARRKNIIAPDGESANSKEIAAIEKMTEEIEEARGLYGDGQPFDEERILDCIVFKAERTSQELYELGKYCLWLKAEIGHGRFLKALQSRDINTTAANWAMLMVQKFGAKFCTVQNLGTRKARLLTTFTKEEIEEYAKGGALKGIPHDDVENKTYSELAEEVKKLNKKVESQKVKHGETIKKMSEELDDMRMRYANQEPPTKEQIAQTALTGMTGEYSIAIAQVNGAIREAYALVAKAEKIEGVNVQQLSEWLGQFSPDIQTFHDVTQTWMDEIDNAGPIKDWRISDLPGGEAQA